MAEEKQTTNPEAKVAEKIVEKESKPTVAAGSSKPIKQLVVIRLRSMIRATGDLRHANMILGLNRKNAAKLVNDTPSMRGMLQKLKDYITYGEIDSETLKLLKSTRAEVASDGTEKNCYRLHPPRGGFERKGTKKPFGIGGAAGDRKEKINDLLKRMIDL